MLSFRLHYSLGFWFLSANALPTNVLTVRKLSSDGFVIDSWNQILKHAQILQKYAKPNKLSQNLVFLFTIGLCFIICLCRKIFNVNMYSSYFVDIFWQFTTEENSLDQLNRFSKSLTKMGSIRMCVDTSVLVNKHD